MEGGARGWWGGVRWGRPAWRCEREATLTAKVRHARLLEQVLLVRDVGKGEDMQGLIALRPQLELRHDALRDSFQGGSRSTSPSTTMSEALLMAC